MCQRALYLARAYAENVLRAPLAARFALKRPYEPNLRNNTLLVRDEAGLICA